MQHLRLQHLRRLQATRFSLWAVSLLLVLIVGACAGLPQPQPVETTPQVSVSAPFAQSETDEAIYSGTVSESNVTVTGSANGAVDRLRYKLNETGWEDADLSASDFSFPVSGLLEGSNTVALRIDGEDGSIIVIVIVIIFDPGDGALPVVNPDPNPRDMVALTADNTLVFFNSGAPQDTDTLPVSGIEGALLGIDFRPADGRLYGLSSTNRLYSIDTETGEATEKSRLSEGFEGGAMSGFDFNPVPDRLRLTASNNQNFRVNVDTGEVIVDGTLAYVDGDDNAGAEPSITASAYTNAFDGAEETELYNIDAELDILVLQDPPNDGGLQTVGPLGVDFAAEGGFDIVTVNGDNLAYAVSESALFAVDLTTGAATPLGMVSGGPYRGLAVVLPSAD
jgi:outer membrane protein assembly factor BamB